MLHPNQFRVNEAWIAFKLNDAPLATESDGDFNLVALMDAASCFILSTAPVLVSLAEPSRLDAKQLLEKGRAQGKQWPEKLILPRELVASHLLSEAGLQGVIVERVAEIDLEVFIGEARASFREHFGGGSTH
jgi:hypothetical protein